MTREARVPGKNKNIECINVKLQNQTKIPQKKRKLLANIFDEYGCKNSQQNFSRPNPTTYQKDPTSQIHKDGSINANQSNAIHHINKRKVKNHMIISKDRKSI